MACTRSMRSENKIKPVLFNQRKF